MNARTSSPGPARRSITRCGPSFHSWRISSPSGAFSALYRSSTGEPSFVSSLSSSRRGGVASPAVADFSSEPEPEPEPSSPRSIASTGARWWSAASRLMTMSSPRMTARVCVVHSGASASLTWRDHVRETECTRRPSEKNGIESPWMMIEVTTMKATMGWIDSARMPVCESGAASALASVSAARVEMKTAPGARRRTDVRTEERIYAGNG